MCVCVCGGGGGVQASNETSVTQELFEKCFLSLPAREDGFHVGGQPHEQPGQADGQAGQQARSLGPEHRLQQIYH